MPAKKKRLVDYSDSSDSEEEGKENWGQPVNPEDSDEDGSKKRSRSDTEDISYYDMTLRTERHSRKFHMSSRVYDIEFKEFEKPFESMHRSFDALVSQIKKDCQVKPRDKMRISFLHPNLNFGIHIPFDTSANVTGNVILDEMERVAQSNDQFYIHDGQMQAEVTVVSMPEGSGRRPMHYGSEKGISAMTYGKKSIVTIHNDQDCSCLARAIVVGICSVNKKDTEEWKKEWNYIRRSDRPHQKEEAYKLLDSVGVSPHQPCGMEEYKRLQEHLYPEYMIKIHDQHGDLLFTPPPMTESVKVIHLYHHMNHYDVIVSIKGFVGSVYYCEHCDKSYNTLGHHVCAHTCDCLAPSLCPSAYTVRCVTCQRCFRSPECYEKHLEVKQKISVCDMYRACPKCKQPVMKDQKDHVCQGVRKCKYCKEMVNEDHDCYIPKYVPSEEQETWDVPYIFYDFECCFETGEHIPNFCVAQRACDGCIDQPVTKPCEHCDQVEGCRQKIFKGKETLKEFCVWLFQPIHKGATAIAHNAQGYDAQFILRYVVDHTPVKPEVIMNGTKILLMKAFGLRLLDSMSFLSMPLSAFPKTFGLHEMAKGWFPFWANTDAFQHYVGPYLPVEYYRPGSMKPEQRKEFLSWYEQQVTEKNVFDFQQEIERYCISDVDILRRGCGEFMKQMMESDEINPFVEATTLAQACNKAWRKNSMPEHSLGLISDAGYPHKTRFSMKGIRWIQTMAMYMNTSIQHALNGGEVQIGSYTVDGYDPDTRTIYEFHGCWTHGCPKCYPKRQTKHTFRNMTYEQLYQETMQRQATLTQQGFRVHSIWECEFDRMIEAQPAYKNIVNQLYVHQDPISPREALFGGRTNAVRLYFEVEENSPLEIKYVDVCSLYPYVNKYRSYPIGHPDILTREDLHLSHLDEYHGLIKCKVLPPSELWLPVLPIHCHKKMVFTLCQACAEGEHTECAHSTHERALVGTWTSVELKKARELGYQVLEVYHVWHWTEWSDQVYSQYVNKYLKMKQEASGYPEGVDTRKKKKEFKQAYLDTEGIELDFVHKNPGRRAFAKTMLNCLWGKNAQNNILPKTEYVDKLSRLYDLMTNGNIKVNYVDWFSHDAFVLVNYTDQADVIQPHVSANVVVASFVTAYARLVLYEQLEKLGKRVLYFDTDSCMYVYDPAQYNVPIVNSRLGQWTDEVPEGKIVKFVALGPKNYGYEYIVQGERRTTCKVKGITLDYDTSQKVNFDSMVECVKQRDTFSMTVHYPSRIKRQRNRQVFSEAQSKTFRSVYTKRVVVNQFHTVPFGYIKSTST